MSDWREITIPLPELVGRLVWWLVVTALVAGIPYALVNGLPRFPSWPWTSDLLEHVAARTAVVLGAYVISVPIHEGLHAAGMLLTGTRRSDISFGVRILYGAVYIHCGAPMPLSAYRFSLLLPVVVTGLIPAIWAVGAGHIWVLIYSYLMIVSALGDLEMVWKLRGLSGDVLVRDHPTLLGCEVQIRPEAGSAD